MPLQLHSSHSFSGSANVGQCDGPCLTRTWNSHGNLMTIKKCTSHSLCLSANIIQYPRTCASCTPEFLTTGQRRQRRADELTDGHDVPLQLQVVAKTTRTRSSQVGVVYKPLPLRSLPQSAPPDRPFACRQGRWLTAKRCCSTAGYETVDSGGAHQPGEWARPLFFFPLATCTG